MKKQWQLYKTLEQIPDSVPESPAASPAGRRMTRLWRSIMDSMSGKDSGTLQLEYLERCLMLDLASSATASGWQRWWDALHRALAMEDRAITAEPKIWQSTDELGRVWWHVYSPRTGERVDLASEDEVCIWIEQSFYR